jgi:hypothetical protein
MKTTTEINDLNTKGEGFLKIIWENTMELGFL